MAGVPLVIHEQNAVAGTANRLLAHIAARICEAFPNTFTASDRRRTTGNPVREELFLETPREPLAGRKPKLLVLGGSLGAEPLNKLLPAALAKVAADVRPQVFHQAGKQHAEITAERYRDAAVEAEVAPISSSAKTTSSSRARRSPMRGNVLIMAGGTGGHVFPALACAREFQARGYSVHWLGTPRGIENELVPQADLPLHLIDVSGLRGKGKLSLLKAPFQLLRALLQARRIVRELQPVCVLGMGGYVTGPGGLAARMAGVPLVIHEQNAVAGTANRLLAHIAARICEAFPNTFKASDRRRTTGNPVREELFLETPRESLAGRKPKLLVLGGSLGAEPLNKLLPAALAKVAADVRPQVFHQAGKQHATITVERYRDAAVEAEV
ncbi:UNVERIFIED_CONTAM: murG, partial [Trichonephila clavipes]